MKIIPELRFPEFQDDGEWENKPLDDLCKLVRGPFGGALKKEIFVQIGFAVYEQSHAIYSDFNSFRYRINAEKFSELKRFAVTANDLIMSCSGTMGKFAIIPENYEPGIINQALLKLTIKKGFDISFVKISLETENNQNQLLSQSAGGAIKNVVSVSQIKELKLAAPQLQEQQKIASCLSSLDELIAAHSQKLDLLKDHKKGLMQNLFPQGGKSVPKFRFPEFENDGDWVEKKLGEVCKMQAGKFVQASEIKDSNADSLFSCYGGNGLRGYTESFTHSGKYSLIGRQGALCGNVNLVDSRFHATEHAVVVTPEENIDTEWLFFVLILLNLNQYATGQAQPGLSVSNLEQVELKIPKTPKEQQKIASCLSAVDELITAQAERIAQLQQHKKGLMQGLFPKMEG
jgi:type I restriction enzyme S subunit